MSRKFSKNWLRVLKITPTCWYGYGTRIQELDFIRCTRGHCTRSVLTQHAATTSMSVPLSATGATHCSDAPRGYGGAGVPLALCAELPRDRQLAISSFIGLR